MKISILLTVTSLLTSACAHKTVHEKCSDYETLSRYGSYDQCYQEISADRARFQQAWSNAWSKKSTNCTSMLYGNTAYTNCN